MRKTKHLSGSELINKLRKDKRKQRKIYVSLDEYLKRIKDTGTPEWYASVFENYNSLPDVPEETDE